MIAVVQRVSSASVGIGGLTRAAIGKGMLVLLGVADDDKSDDADYLAAKIAALRIFPDPEGMMNLNVLHGHGEVLVISQFTLLGNTRRGNRPSFGKAAKPEVAIPLYELFVELLRQRSKVPLKTGEFGADMQVSLVNDGPVTIIIDSRDKSIDAV